jgi:group I intron endonuclease
MSDEMKSGIYQIRNVVNGKVYVGQAQDFNHRWRKHKYDLARHNHHSKHLERAWYQYGSENFEWIVVERCEPIAEILNLREQHWLDTVRIKRGNGTLGTIDSNLAYNSSFVAGSVLGTKHSDTTRQLMSVSHEGLFAGEKHPMWGKHHSEEAKSLISSALKDKPKSRHTKHKMSVAQRGDKGSGAKFSWEDIRALREKWNQGTYTQMELAAEYNMSKTNVFAIVNHKTWKEESM